MTHGVGDRDAAQQPPGASRRLAAAAFGATLLLASALLFFHVPSTEIELDGTVTGLGFTSTDEQPLTRPAPLDALGASGLRGVQLPPEVVPARARAGAAAEAVTAVQVVVARVGDRTGTIVLDRIVVPAGARVRVVQTDVPRQYRVTVRSAHPTALTIHADVMGPLRIQRAAAPATTIDVHAPRAIDLVSTSNSLDLDFTLPAGSPAPRWQQLAADELVLYAVEDERDVGRPRARAMSTVVSGSLYFESLGGGERTLRAGELIRFDETRGVIRTLQLGEQGIVFTYQGVVRGMRSGSGERPRTLMPTLLDWLRQRHGLSLLWGTALYLFGVAMTVRRWWSRGR